MRQTSDASAEDEFQDLEEIVLQTRERVKAAKAAKSRAAALRRELQELQEEEESIAVSDEVDPVSAPLPDASNPGAFVAASLKSALPEFLSQVKEALGLPATQAAPVAGPSKPPPVPVPVSAASSSAPPPIVLENSESDDDVQTLAVPFRSASLEAFLPMVSTDDSWSTDTEFRNTYRAEVATFFVPVAGEDASATRLRECMISPWVPLNSGIDRRVI